MHRLKVLSTPTPTPPTGCNFYLTTHYLFSLAFVTHSILFMSSEELDFYVDSFHSILLIKHKHLQSTTKMEDD